MSKILTILTIFALALSAEYKILAEDFPPFQYERDGEVRGVSSAIVKAILKELGSDLDIEIKEWSEAYELTKSESGYILFSTSRTQEREELFKWVGPIATSKNLFYQNIDSNFTIQSLSDVNSLKVGAGESQASTTMLKSKGFEDNLEILESDKETYLALMDSKIDTFVANSMVFPFRVKELNLDSSKIKSTGLKLYDNELYIAFSKDIPDYIIEHWQHILDILIESYEYETLYKDAMIKAYQDFDIEPTDERFKAPDVITLTKNEWRMVGSSSEIDLDLLNRGCIESIWIYRDGSWIIYKPNSEKPIQKIEKNQAFWISTNENCKVELGK